MPVFPLLGKASAVALLAGACLCLWLPTLPPWPLLLAALLAGIWGLSRHDWRRPLGALLLGIGWAGLHATHGLSAQLPPKWERREVEVSGRVIELPQVETRRTRFLLHIDGDEAQPAPLRGKLLQLSWYDDFDATEPGPRTRLHAGERWRFVLRVRAPRGLRNPGGFDSERHALERRVAASGYVRDPERAAPLAPARGIDAWRERMSARIAKRTPPDASSFVRALALGDTGGLDDRDWETLRATGLTHLVAISGFHVGLVSGFFALLAALLWRAAPALARRVPRPQAAAVSALLGALGYAAVAGFALPTVRTLLMIAIVALAWLLRRGLRAGDALALAAIAVLLFDPLSPLAAGFWLSFAGVAWLLWCLPHEGRRPLLKEFLSAQGVATVGLLPLTVVLFGQASLVGPLANLVAIPWWSLVVVPLALLGTALEAAHAGFGEWAWHAAAGCFDASWRLFSALAQSRFALWWLPEARGFALPLALFGAFWLLLPRGVPGKPLALLLWLPLLWPDRELPRPGEAQLVVIDVGQGLSVLVRTHSHALLYDAGPAVRDGFDAGERAVVPTLRALGVARLDRAVISHGDNDHAGGFDAVKRVVPVGATFAPAGSPTPAESGCVAGRGWEWDGVKFRFLHPTAGFPYLANESSCVLRIETVHGAALLTGDIGEVVERMLLRRAAADLRADVVLAAHHGSKGSSDPAFVAATGARLALVSAGHGNRFGHPAPGVVARWRHAGAELLDTADSGALGVWLSADGLAVRERRVAFPRLWDAARRYSASRTGQDAP
ncbi:DNA internalization-related competence protein ComEC/Rec2 [Pseudoxanthomonas sangjuensis]|uniref:DNA internalization-related competence protein ComEC/Rec2 n=1 Tax=Pseudoxanthomonas sangjuensis TaxID=1503750 RepID=UPI001390F601|nr:DNA internalization-related competence protein ComEC/Rec2 [Pseudoxanthomonas sangjuensis]KAF1708769.1 DNA internalization-related competence protein ComEC/Rec2 [Pseudoxanthomonas sangjuensis]